MSLVHTTPLYKLIDEHQTRYEQYVTAQQKSHDQDSTDTIQWHSVLNGQFLSYVLPQLEQAKTLLAEHGYGADIVIKRKAIQQGDDSVLDAITQVTLSFSGSHSSDAVLSSQNSETNRLLFFISEHSHYISARYITALASSEVQVLYFYDESGRYYSQAPHWHYDSEHPHHPPCNTYSSESQSIISDFINLVFLQVRGKLTA
ncbi:hypothetical protein BGP78_01445 [Pseudoalteromonas sp. MSK9-3]|uniref:hypothetical protein n=1 Tax=Pseudoalteromonas sp. MSK9-3 TaxID=1897633 RepID=UPI000E6CB2D2|nr:hypothetical protein [Pseudoalteromonas sp. MSK9-3]RJE76940.1 hypothetical protein BGP78_01445 [Pseudoalteromonas sp. MSK9-3]